MLRLKLMAQKSSANQNTRTTKALFGGVFACACIIVFVFSFNKLKEKDRVIAIPIEIPKEDVGNMDTRFNRSFYSATTSNSYINIHNSFFNLYLARTKEERQMGLSGREKLTKDEGMFFVFPEEGRHGIWMKDMKFSIDVLWLSKEGEVVHLIENMKPESFPKSYYPRNPSIFIVELPVGTISKTKIKVGEKIEGDVFGYVSII